jgi:DNA-binding response OmpR family regulator
MKRQRIRALPGGKLVPIIIVTSLSDTSHKVTVADIGADDFVSKPVNRV